MNITGQECEVTFDLPRPGTTPGVTGELTVYRLDTHDPSKRHRIYELQTYSNGAIQGEMRSPLSYADVRKLSTKFALVNQNLKEVERNKKRIQSMFSYTRREADR